MFNVLLDEMPTTWNGYPINTDFRIGIQVSQCVQDEELTESERFSTALGLVFSGVAPSTIEEALECLNWYMTGFSHDNIKGGKAQNIMDWDIDQWRIYSAFKSQYNIDLNADNLHWFSFMGMLANLEECSFTRVMEIRQKKITSKMSPEEKKALKEAKKIYALKTPDNLSAEEKEKEQEALAEFNKMLGR